MASERQHQHRQTLQTSNNKNKWRCSKMRRQSQRKLCAPKIQVVHDTFFHLLFFPKQVLHRGALALRLGIRQCLPPGRLPRLAPSASSQLPRTQKTFFQINAKHNKNVCFSMCLPSQTQKRIQNFFCGGGWRSVACKTCNFLNCTHPYLNIM